MDPLSHKPEIASLSIQVGHISKKSICSVHKHRGKMTLSVIETHISHSGWHCVRSEVPPGSVHHVLLVKYDDLLVDELVFHVLDCEGLLKGVFLFE